MINLNKDKYINSLLFFVENCNNAYLGKTKLNKLFYYLDFISYRDNKTSVTGDIYICREYGPVPAHMDEIKNESVKKSLIKAEIVDQKTGKERYSIISKPDLTVFTKEEITLLTNICHEFRSYSTRKIVDKTHFEAPWFYAEKNCMIDYNYANDIELFA